MFLSIRHTTIYTYDRRVFLQPHRLRVTPRADACRSLIEHELVILPQPSGASRSLETDGSFSDYVWFERGDTKEFSVDSRLVVELKNMNPFEFIIYPYECQNLPMRYPSGVLESLNCYPPNEPDPMIDDLAGKILRQANGKTLDFLIILCRYLKENFHNRYRKTGDPYPGGKTLRDQEGSCRDLAVLFMAVGNAVGLASRFVSGYYFGGNPDPAHLHAWVEVYIPGGGWRGFDPTLGLACGCHHIALCASGIPAQTSYVEGFLVGQVRSEMTIHLQYLYQNEMTARRISAPTQLPIRIEPQAQQ